MGGTVAVAWKRAGDVEASVREFVRKFITHFWAGKELYSLENPLSIVVRKNLRSRNPANQWMAEAELPGLPFTCYGGDDSEAESNLRKKVQDELLSEAGDRKKHPNRTRGYPELGEIVSVTRSLGDFRAWPELRALLLLELAKPGDTKHLVATINGAAVEATKVTEPKWQTTGALEPPEDWNSDFRIRLRVVAGKMIHELSIAGFDPGQLMRDFEMRSVRHRHVGFDFSDPLGLHIVEQRLNGAPSSSLPPALLPLWHVAKQQADRIDEERFSRNHDEVGWKVTGSEAPLFIPSKEIMANEEIVWANVLPEHKEDPLERVLRAGEALKSCQPAPELAAVVPSWLFKKFTGE